MPSRSELVAHGRDTESIARAIGADLVIFQTMEDLEASVRQLNPSITTFDCSVFTGKYVTGGVTEEYLRHLEGMRSDSLRGKPLPGGLDAATLKLNGLTRVTTEDLEMNSASGTSSPGDDTVGLHNTFNRS